MSTSWYNDTIGALSSFTSSPPGTPSRTNSRTEGNASMDKRIADYEAKIRALEASMALKDKQLIKSKARCKHVESSLREKELILKSQVSNFDGDSTEVKQLLDTWTLERTALLDQIKNLEDFVENQQNVTNVSWRNKDEALPDELPIGNVSDHQKQIIKMENMITSLREQILDYSGQLTELTAEIAQLRRSAITKRDLNDSFSSNNVEALQQQIEELMRERDSLLGASNDGCIEVRLKGNDISFQSQSTSLSTGERDSEIHALEEQLIEKENTISALVKSCANAERALEDQKELVKKLQDKLAADGSSDQLAERDEAIATLVKQSMSQERKVKQLTEEMEALQKAQADSSSKSEVDALRNEVEMYASQVLEQENEIDELRTMVGERNERIKALEKEVNAARHSTSLLSERSFELTDREAEIDELKEANRVQLDELRLLRRKSEELEMLKDRVARERSIPQQDPEETQRLQQAADKLKKENRLLSDQVDEYEEKIETLERKVRRSKQALDEVEELESQIFEQKQLIEKLRAGQNSQPAPPARLSMDEMELEETNEENRDLKTKIETLTKSLEHSKKTISDLEEMLAEKSSRETGAFDVEREEMIAEIENLTDKLQEAERLLKETEAERGLITEFKDKLELADEAREKSEKMIVDTYERKISLLTLDKDVTIDKLRKQLSKEKVESTDKFEELQEQLEKYEAALKDLKEEAEAEIRQRETRIVALEQTLTAQEQLLNNMKTEMDHLQGSMEHTVYDRREEIENLQQELMELGTVKTRQEREIKLLQSQIGELRVAHANQINLFKAKISDLESTQKPEAAPKHDSAIELMEQQLSELQERVQKLNRRNETLQEDNRALRGHLEMIEKQEAKSEAMIQLQKKTGELKKELSTYKEKVTELEKASTPPRKKNGRMGFLGRRKDSTNDLTESK